MSAAELQVGWSWSERKHYLDPNRPPLMPHYRQQAALCGADAYIPERNTMYDWDKARHAKLPTMPLCKKCERIAAKRAES